MSEISSAAQPPTWRWRIGPYEFARYRRAHALHRGLWECSAHGSGVGGHRTPVGAFLHLRRWLREPVKPTDD